MLIKGNSTNITGKLKKPDANNNDQSIFVLTTLETTREMKLKFSQGSTTVL